MNKLCGLWAPCLLLVSFTSASTASTSSGVIGFLQVVSAGHTGCLPQDNVITNVNINHAGSGTWIATCLGANYVCSEVNALGNSGSFSCAPAAKQAN
jgi:hypothetical protein